MKRAFDEPVASLSRYLSEIGAFPLLSPEEERALAESARRGNPGALRGLVEANLRFVVSLASRYRAPGVSLSDLIHEGNLGLIAAARRFDPDRKVRFLTYASFFVKEAVVACLHRNTGALRLPPRRVRLLARVRRALGSLERDLRRLPSEEELAMETGLPVDEVRFFLSRILGDLSLEEASDQAPSSGRTLEESIVHRSVLRALQRALSDLSPRERRVLKARFGLGESDPRTLAEIAGELRLSIERVRQIEVAAISRLRSSSQLGVPPAAVRAAPRR